MNESPFTFDDLRNPAKTQAGHARDLPVTDPTGVCFANQAVTPSGNAFQRLLGVPHFIGRLPEIGKSVRHWASSAARTAFRNFILMSAYSFARRHSIGSWFSSLCRRCSIWVLLRASMIPTTSFQVKLTVMYSGISVLSSVAMCRTIHTREQMSRSKP